MFRICIRKITRAALPHPWFDIEHPMLKADPELMKMVKVLEKRGIKKKEEDRDMSLEEHNTEDVTLYDVPHEVYEKEPALVQTLTKVYSNYNPTKILESAASLPGFNFDQKVQELEKFESNYTYQEMNDAKVIDNRYVVSRFAPPKFKKLVDIYLSKMPIFGFVVPYEQSQMALELNSAFDKEFHSFLLGDGAFLDEEERHVFRRFLIRQINSSTYLDDRDIPFITEAEDNFMLGMINWPGTDDHEYRCYYRPYFREYDINKEMWTRNQNKLLIILSRYLWFWNYNR